MIARAGRTALAALAALLACAAIGVAPAYAAEEFGLSKLEVSFSEANGAPATQAGSHPFAMDTYFEVNRHDEGGKPFVDGGDIKDLILEQARGFVGDTTAVPRCSTLDFSTFVNLEPSCPDNTAVGVTAVMINHPDPAEALPAAVYNLTPPPGVPVRLGFVILETPVVIDVGVKPEPDYNVTGGPVDTPQPLTVFGAALQLWGEPADPAHDFARGHCATFALNNTNPGGSIAEGRVNLHEGGPQCADEGAPDKPFLTLPRTCEALSTNYHLTSWAQPPEEQLGQIPTGPFTGCGKLEFNPSISAKATAADAQTGTGLDFGLSFEDPTDHTGQGLTEPHGIAQSDMKKIVVTLPEGVTANPSLAEGLEVCTPADLNRETLEAEPGQGCPNGSKIGTVSVNTPLVSEEIVGNVFIASSYENPFDSLLAFYIVLKDKNLGILVKVPAEVEPDPRTGQLVTTVDNTPQFPFDSFHFHFREGQRAPLITPPSCGTYQVKAEMTPWARPDEVIARTASFQIAAGVGGGPCPQGSAPFHPGFGAGTLNNAAGRYSPFDMRLTRADGEQDMGKFSFVLPPGVVPKLAGIPYCPEAAIAQAKSRTGPHGGREELEHPSCPAASQIGRTLAGAGVGSALTYVPGSLYLAGPYHGDPISAVAITPAVAGPFDAGTVVVREALRLNPVTHVGEVDGAASDPIPHILKGIPLNVRDLRVYADRPEFTLNATSCEPFAASSTIWGDGTALAPAGETPVTLSARYQAADCASLGFKPKLAIELKGATKRGSFPALHAVYAPRPGDANLKSLALLFPHSEFIEQGHFRTICTRVQFAAAGGNGEQCPAGSVYGHISASTPLLAAPLEGPVYLRSSNHNLPDAVFALHGLVDIDVVVRIDSKNGGLRATVEESPDAPVSKAIVEMQGGQKGLFVNSTNVCRGRHLAKARIVAQNGKVDDSSPPVRAQCPKRGKRR
jgi:hypothetical protein